MAGVPDTSQYLEVDMLKPYRFTAVHTQGRADADEWVTSYKIQYYDNATASWITYSNSSGTDVRQNNFDVLYGRLKVHTLNCSKLHSAKHWGFESDIIFARTAFDLI